MTKNIEHHEGYFGVGLLELNSSKLESSTWFTTKFPSIFSWWVVLLLTKLQLVGCFASDKVTTFHLSLQSRFAKIHLLVLPVHSWLSTVPTSIFICLPAHIKDWSIPSVKSNNTASCIIYLPPRWKMHLPLFPSIPKKLTLQLTMYTPLFSNTR